MKNNTSLTDFDTFQSMMICIFLEFILTSRELMISPRYNTSNAHLSMFSCNPLSFSRRSTFSTCSAWKWLRSKSLISQSSLSRNARRVFWLRHIKWCRDELNRKNRSIFLLNEWNTISFRWSKSITMIIESVILEIFLLKWTLFTHIHERMMLQISLKNFSKWSESDMIKSFDFFV